MNSGFSPHMLYQFVPRYPIVFCYNMFYKFANHYAPQIHRERTQILHREGFKSYQLLNRTFSQQSIQKRAEMFGDRLQKILHISGAKKCHVIGHSFAGVDLRCLAALQGGHQFIESVVTIASPNRGFKFGELLKERRGQYKHEHTYRSLMMVGMVEENAEQFNAENMFEFNSLCEVSGNQVPVASITGVTVNPQSCYFENGRVFREECENDGLIWFEEGNAGVHICTLNMDHSEIVGISPKENGAPALRAAADFAKISEIDGSQEMREKLGGFQ